MKMTKQEFKARWESDDNGGGITFNDIADCAIAWGLSTSPKAQAIDSVRYRVLKACDCVDAEDFLPLDQLEKDCLSERLPS